MSVATTSSVVAAQSAAALEAFIQASLLRHFRGNKATSELGAIEMDDFDWMELGLNPNNTWWNNFDVYIQRYGIRQSSAGKFWMDLDAFLDFRKQQAQKMTLFWIIFGIFTAGMILLIPLIAFLDMILG